ncbi:MAG: hypothetical protein LBU46_02250, partial [Candidatus Accumulibacter sp.]|nr:hypothetical protein [Accumulibacter sp.]
MAVTMPVRKPKREKPSPAARQTTGELFPFAATPSLSLENYQLPGQELLDEPNPADADAIDPKELLRLQDVIIDCLE